MAQRQLQHALEYLLSATVLDPRWITVVGDHPGDVVTDAELLFGLTQQNRSTIRGDIIGTELDVDRILGVEIDPGLRVTLWYEKSGWL